jgi:hypothetical protein
LNYAITHWFSKFEKNHHPFYAWYDGFNWLFPSLSLLQADIRFGEAHSDDHHQLLYSFHIDARLSL